jgi:hypothetical protein
MLIPQAGSDYQAAQITLDAGHARDIMLMLLDVHAVLDHIYLDGTRPQATSPARAWLRESASSYTLPGLIDALNEVISQLCQAERDAFHCTSASTTADGPPACPRF